MKPKNILLACVLLAQGIAVGAPVSITSGTLVYNQNFDSLGTGSPAWTDDSTIAGWYAQINNATTAIGTAQAADGNTVLSGLLNCGAAAATDRALGSKATGTGNFANIAYAVAFVNNSTKPVNLKRLQYHAEYWRGNSVASTGEKFTLFYQISAATVTNIISGTNSATAAAGAGFSAMPSGANTTLINAGVAALDGNTVFNAVDFSPAAGAIAPILPGQHFTLKWTDTNEANTDGFQAIDDLQVEFEEVDCALAATVSGVVRHAGADVTIPTDDTVDFTVTVVRDPVNAGATWTVTAPGSVTNGTTGSYGVAKNYTGVPIAEFATALNLTMTDSIVASCVTSTSVTVPRIIGTNNFPTTGGPIHSTSTLPTQWVYDDTARTMVMNNGGGGTRKVISSEVIDLTSVGAVQFSGELFVHDTSSGNETADSFTAYLIIDGNTGSPINLIDPAQDTGGTGTAGDGILSGGELTPATAGPPPVSGAGDFTHALRSYVIPASANSVQIILEGINDSANEFFTLQNLKLSNPPPTLQATAGTVVFDNHGTDSAVDDTITAPVTIDGINLGASTGWFSNVSNPASGLYATPNPITFGPFDASLAPVAVTLEDNVNAGVTASFSLSLPARTLTLGTPTNIQRHENGPGIADDTVTFDLAIAGANGGPRWKTTTAGVTPANGNFGTVTFTVAAPLPASPLSVVFEDISYSATTQTASVALPGRYVIGQKDFGGGPLDVLSDIATVPAAIWVNDAALRTLTNNTGTNAAQVKVESETIDLSTVGAVHFSATLDANDTSTGSNYDLPDKFKLELIIDGGAPVSLVGPYDVGNGVSAVPFVAGSPVPNGAPDGWINGYTGTAAAADGFTTAIDEYNAHKDRDEYNRNAQNGAEAMVAVLTFAYDIPAGANSVQLVLTSEGIQGTETAILKDVLFTTSVGPVDTDGDGMTDAYEDANGLNKNDPGDKLTDLDGDGQSNYAEFLAGTGANDAGSRLQISDITPGAPGTVNVSVSTVAGKKYQLQESTDLGNTDAWADVAGALQTATGATTTFPGIPVPYGADTVHFLRAKVVP